jgi:tRNA threonylcarbamoyladenosine biosynthesis protein TsaB
LLLLGIDTATPVTNVAAGSESGPLAAAVIRRERGHAEDLVPAIRWILERSAIEPASIAGIAVGTGPGLFTGLRVGVATAKALAQSWRVPMVAVSSLDLLAFEHRLCDDLVCAVIDARRGEVFSAFYRQVPGGVLREGGFSVWRPDRLAAELEARGERTLLVGDGALVHRQAFERLGDQLRFSPEHGGYPSAEALVELALPRFAREEFTPPLNVHPIYVRQPDVDEGWRRKSGGLASAAAGEGAPRW